MGQKAFSAEMIKMMAQKIDFVSFDMIKTSRSELRSHWYHYDNMDLYYFEKSDGRIVKIHISVFGQVIEWNLYDGAQTGLMIEEEQAGVDDMQVVQYDSQPSESTLAQGFLIIENAFNISEQIRKELILMLNTAPQKRPGLLRKLKRSFLGLCRRLSLS